MNVVGIIAEYNPMHNGHIYNIQQARKLTNATYAIVIMSGSFTEQGNIACINKFDRASIAIQNGADLVIELPTVYAISSAENFAFGAVNILNSLGVVTHLAFGAESENICELKSIANAYLNNKEQIIQNIKIYTKKGINSGEAYSKAINELLDEIPQGAALPNNILGIEYLKSLTALESQIKPVLVHRISAGHSEQKVSELCKYASSTSIRNALSTSNLTVSEKLAKIQHVVPENTFNYLTKNSFNTNSILWDILKYEIIKLNKVGLKQIHEITEGLENKLYKQALMCNNYEDYIFSVKSKRYTLSKIKRICIYILLGITKEKYSKLKDVNYARILKVKKNSSELLSKICKSANNTVVKKVTNNILSDLPDNIKESIELDILAHNIFNSSNMDYTNKIIQP